MKLLFCQDCLDIVAPNSKDFVVRWCECRRHAVWWENGRAGRLVLHDAFEGRPRPGSVYDGMPGTPKAWVIGLHNMLLSTPFTIGPEEHRQIVEAADGYLFKTRGSLVIRLRPLESNDTRWSYTLPGTPP